MESRLFDISLSNIFFGYVSLGKGNKSKNKQMGLYQLESYCTAKETINKMKRQLSEYENIFANDISNKGEYPKCIFKNSYNSISKKCTT